MFVDKVNVTIQAGNGGDGKVSFRHEKFIDKGGPNGGDGGNGGDIIVRASQNQSTLATFRYSKLIKAKSGSPGLDSNKHGKAGADTIVDLPVGTIITNDDGQVVADLTENKQEVKIAAGGRGGFGNAHFVSSTRQVPRVAEKGDQGDSFKATFELKMIADVGLVGLPNAGKSTFLASVSNAKPEIANYPFTTLNPNLGVVDIDGQSCLMADIPGLIEGASDGKGLGDEFLRHVERTAVLLHLIDAYQEDVTDSYRVIQQELASYKVDLTTRPQIVVLTKIEGLDKEMIDEKIAELKKLKPKPAKVIAISAHSKAGVKELLRLTMKTIKKEREIVAEKETNDGVIVLTIDDKVDSWKVKKTKAGFLVTGRKIEKFAGRTDFENEHGLDRLRDIMKKMGIMHELRRAGINSGDKIIIASKGTLEY